MIISVFSLVAAYLAVTMLLLSLNLASLWRWWIKAAAIVITTIFFGVTYLALNGLMGWPTTQKPLGRFNLISSRITEPDRRTNAGGHIYLWTDELDVNNVSFGRPRSYELPYSKGLAHKVADAQEKRDHGIEVMGKISEIEAPKPKDAENDSKQGRMQDDNGQQTPTTDTVAFKEEGSDLSFEDLPPILLPQKSAQ